VSVRYRCDECGDEADAASAVGWVAVQPLGNRPAPDPSHLCRLCWARTVAAAHPAPAPGDEHPQLSEHTQNRDILQ
jgi:hypothetical protein